MMEGEDGESTDDRAFGKKSVWARISVVAAGPVFNFIMAFVFSFILLSCNGYDVPKITEVSEGFAAEQAGMQAGNILSLQFITENIFIFTGKSVLTPCSMRGRPWK